MVRKWIPSDESCRRADFFVIIILFCCCYQVHDHRIDNLQFMVGTRVLTYFINGSRAPLDERNWFVCDQAAKNVVC